MTFTAAQREPVHLNPREIAAALGGTARGNQISAPGPGHSRKDRSLRILLDPSAPEGFVIHAHAGEDAIAMRDYVRAKAGLLEWKPNGQERPAPVSHVRLVKPAEPPRQFSDQYLIARGYHHVVTYDYTSVDGEVLFEVLRYEHPNETKTFIQRQPDGNGGWHSGRGDPVFYRLHEIAANMTDPVFVTEGEKDADRLASLGYLATTVPNGSWPDDLSVLFGRTIYVLADNDSAGDKRASTAISRLEGIATVYRIDLPELPDKGDVTDWLDAVQTTEELEAICRAAAPVPANDNTPAVQPLSIFEWTVDRFVGEAPAVEYLVDGVIPLGIPGMVSAAGDTGKSFALLELHRQVAFGSSIYAPPIFGGRVVGDFASWPGANPDNWTPVNCTVAKDTVNKETGEWAGEITSTSTSQPRMTQVITGAAAIALRDKYITVASRFRIPASNTAGVYGPDVVMSSNGGGAYNASSRGWAITSGNGRDGFIWGATSLLIASNITDIEVRTPGFYTTTGLKVVVDRIIAVEGQLPYDRA
ncbi:AAA family ATPase [Rhizobium yanglingense]